VRARARVTATSGTTRLRRACGNAETLIWTTRRETSNVRIELTHKVEECVIINKRIKRISRSGVATPELFRISIHYGRDSAHSSNRERARAQLCYYFTPSPLFRPLTHRPLRPRTRARQDERRARSHAAITFRLSVFPPSSSLRAFRCE